MATLDILIKADNQASGPLGQINKALGGLGGAASAAVKAAGLAAAASVTAVTGAVAVGVGKAAELEQATADIASVMGITFDEAKPLSDLITQLGIDPKLKVDAVGASDAIMQLAQSGVSMTDILNGAARSTVLLSNATGADMTTAAAVGSDAMALFGIKAEDMSKAVNGITGVTVASKFGIQDYALALAQGGGVAAAVGVSFDDFNTTIAAISPYFSSGSDAGTSFKTMLQRLVPSSNEAEGAMMQLGLITADGANQFFDANGQMKDMKDIAAILNTALAGLSEEQKSTALSTIFGSDSMRAAIAIADAGPAKFDAVAASIAGIDAEASAATRVNTFSGQMEILGGVVDGLLTQVGTAFLPVLRSLANWATQFASDNGPAIVKWFNDLAGWVKEITPLALKWGQVFIGAFGEVGAWLQGQQTSFALLNNVWALLSAAVGNAIFYITNFIRDNWPIWVANLRKWGEAAWQWLVDAWPTVLAKLQQWTGAVFAFVQANLPNWIANLGTWAKAIWQWIVDVTPTVLAKLGEMWNSLTSWVTDPAKRTELLTKLLAVWTGFTQWAGGLWNETIKPKLAQLWLDLHTWINGHVPSLTPWIDGVIAAATTIINGFRVHWPEITSIVTTAADKISADAKRITSSLDSIGSWFSGGNGAKAKTDWAAFWLGVLTAATGAIGGLINMVANLLESFDVLGKAFQAIGTGDWAGLEVLNQRARELSKMMDLFKNPMYYGLDLSGQIGGKAEGGSVRAGTPYIVGERRPELFVPQQNGTIVPDAGSTTNNYNTWNVNVAGTGRAGSDVMGSVQLMRALYG